MKYRKVKTLMAAIRKDLGVTDAQLEHALDLDHGAIKKAEKAIAPPPELMAVLKIVYTYPWMLKVGRWYCRSCISKLLILTKTS